MGKIIIVKEDHYSDVCDEYYHGTMHFPRNCKRKSKRNKDGNIIPPLSSKDFKFPPTPLILNLQIIGIAILIMVVFPVTIYHLIMMDWLSILYSFK